MRFTHHVPLARIAAVVSTLGIVGVVACSDASTTTPRVGVGSAVLDKGKGSGGNGDQGDHDNRGPGNQNNPKDTANQNQNDLRVKLDARLMPVTTDTTFRGAEGNAEFESRTTEMKFKISVEHIAAGTVVNFFVGTTMIGSATTRAGGDYGERRVMC